ncbi:hypothetical protein DPMN_125318 [Dreissena polymorpha]|uniref:Uncharacterized protein n=1 Tax=Dreissena polymorpha TaxID=45954 RepID=A0A9D4GV67_DREPO|nr:hypothetical protein DPMN_125318 [Dreissena polymorpha]
MSQSHLIKEKGQSNNVRAASASHTRSSSRVSRTMCALHKPVTLGQGQGSVGQCACCMSQSQFIKVKGKSNSVLAALVSHTGSRSRVSQTMCVLQESVTLDQGDDHSGR